MSNEQAMSTDGIVELFHVTCLSKIASIGASGLNARSFWSMDRALTDYYRETVRDESEDPIVLTVRLHDLDQSLLAPDRPGIEEPITTAIGKTEEEVAAEWECSDKSWNASLDIIYSIAYLAPIANTELEVVDDDGVRHPLADYLALIGSNN